MQTAAPSRSRIITFALTVVLAFGYMAAMRDQADAKPAPPTVTVVESLSYQQAGVCRHIALFEVSGAKGKWASYQAEQSVDGGLSWTSVSGIPARIDIKADRMITVDRGFQGELAIRIRLVKRESGITQWVEAPSTNCR